MITPESHTFTAIRPHRFFHGNSARAPRSNNINNAPYSERRPMNRTLIALCLAAVWICLAPYIWSAEAAVNDATEHKNDKLRVRSTLTVHAPAGGRLHSTPARLHLRLEIENLGAEITLARPTLEAGNTKDIPVKWYGIAPQDQNKEWSGVLKAGEKKEVVVICNLDGEVTPHAEFEIKTQLDSLNIAMKTHVKPGVVSRYPCGCDRSEQFIAELLTQSRSDAQQTIANSLASIAERERRNYVTQEMIVHRLRLMAFAETLK
jgi:hypothetical protein